MTEKCLINLKYELSLVSLINEPRIVNKRMDKCTHRDKGNLGETKRQLSVALSMNSQSNANVCIILIMRRVSRRFVCIQTASQQQE